MKTHPTSQEVTKPNRTTVEDLLKVNEDGETFFHVAARDNGLRYFTNEYLTAANLTVQREGSLETPLHYAAAEGLIASVPSHILTEANLSRETSDGSTVFHYAAFGLCLKDLPCSVITKKNMLREDHEANTVLHFITQVADFERLPDEVLSIELFSKANIFGLTVFHTAARYGSLAGIPKRLFTREAIFAEDFRNRTVIEYAVENKVLNCLPIELVVGEYPRFLEKLKMCIARLSKEKAAGVMQSIASWTAALGRAVLDKAHAKGASQVKSPLPLVQVGGQI